MTAFPSVAVIGFGTMGQAISAGLVEAGGFPPERIHPADPNHMAVAPKAAAMGVTLADSPAEAAKASDVVLLCVKPKEIGPVLKELSKVGALNHHPLVISIAAGVTLASLESHVPQGTPVVRAMPNTACSVHQGMVVLSPGQAASEDHLAKARTLFEPIARVMSLEEKHLDAVTALSGSGPAFVFVILEALAEGGVQCGLPRAVAQELAAQMTLGAATMALKSGKHTAALKDEVCTPAGSTIAGLMVLEDGKLRSTIARGIEHATRVAGGLGK
ncbi:pyrroline-5-carboxylate reductase [Holophaga foetida]|uniref:pyrroline-5-carboxylate reductase n=1 Tax=Holophaga foetida TaxID=35839 RepID=UPI00024753B1|nr:pyrroline-5-carboxylate reductase [Holophaga foetida]